MRSWFILAGALCAACVAQRGGPTADELFPPRAPTQEHAAPAPVAPTAEAPTPVAPPSSATAVESNGGGYLLHIAPAPNSVPANVAFDLEVWIAAHDKPDELARDISLAVSASMPEHGHGMNREPLVERADDGHFVVRGMLLHMTGRWELYFDVTRGALTERAQCEVVLE